MIGNSGQLIGEKFNSDEYGIGSFDLKINDLDVR